jgi:hypothetical protein
MDRKDLHTLWQKAQKKIIENQKLTKMEIEAYIKPRIRKTSLSIKFNLLFYSALALVVIGLLLINCMNYFSNSIILIINVSIIYLSGYILYFGWNGFKEFRDTETGSGKYTTELKKKLNFFNRIYERWLLFIPILTLSLIYSINTMIDNQDGIYKINKPFLYISINLIIFIGIYLMNKVHSNLILADFKKYILDLENEVLEKTLEIDIRRKRYIWVFISITIILIIFFILGLIKSMSL